MGRGVVISGLSLTLYPGDFSFFLNRNTLRSTIKRTPVSLQDKEIPNRSDLNKNLINALSGLSLQRHQPYEQGDRVDSLVIGLQDVDGYR